MVKLNSAGTLSQDLSYFLSLGKQKNIYIEKNINQKEQLLRVGFLNPFTQTTSINKIGAGTGINANKSDCTDSYYKSPLKQTSFQGFTGAEYSYMYNNKLLFVASIGKTQDNLSRKLCVDKYDIDYASKTQKVFNISYQNNGYNIGIMYDKLSDSELTNYSVISFAEKDFNNFYLYLSYIQRDDFDKSYTGNEDMIYYNLSEDTKIKLYYSSDNEENQAYSIGMNRYYKKFIFGLNIGSRDEVSTTNDLVSFSIKYYL
jgi:hypothetical protein